MLLLSLFTVPLAATAAVLPTTLSPRAGGPIGKPIPASCTLTPLFPTTLTPAFAPSPSFVSAHQIYASYFPASEPLNETATFQQCLEQCYGYGNPGECVANVWAHNVTYTTFGVQNRGAACLFFGKEVQRGDLVGVTDGSYVGALAVNRKCP